MEKIDKVVYTTHGFMMSCFQLTQPPRGEEYGVNMGKP